MTNPPPRPSLLQAGGSEPYIRSLAHRHHHDSTHYYRHSGRQHLTSGNDQVAVEPADTGSGVGEQEPSANHNNLNIRNGVAPSESSFDNIKERFESLPQQVIVQNALYDSIKSSSSALYQRSAISTPDSVSADSVSGKAPTAFPTASQAVVATLAAVLDPTSGPDTSPTDSSVAATPDASIKAPLTTQDWTSATEPAASNSTTSPQASGLVSAHLSSASIYPTIVDLRNGTSTIINGNSSFVPASLATSTTSNPTLVESLSLRISQSSPSSNSSSSHLSALSSTTLSPTASADEQFLLTTYATASAKSASASASNSDSDSSQIWPEATSTHSDDGFQATPVPLHGVVRPSPSSGSAAKSSAASGPEPQKVRIIGSVCGSVAGVAFLAVLALLALRYKKKRSAGALLGSGRLGSTASGTLTGRDSMAVAERPGPSTVAASFSSLARKRDSRQPVDSVEEGDERGFYRVAGRKLPPVLVNGGDGYTDPRESVMSGGSDYHRGSQAFDVAATGDSHQLVLGAPMRPISGVPIMRSGPARTPVTENPFVDPLSPPATEHSPSRRPVSRASASKFHESI